MTSPDPFVELLDEGRVRDAMAARVRERALRRAAQEGATLAGLLVDLAEGGAAVAVHTQAGTRHHGTLLTVGADFCVLRTESGADVHVRLDAVASLRPHPRERRRPPEGDRLPVVDLLLVEVLGRMADERPRVVLGTRGDGERVAGQLRSVGSDVVTLALDGGQDQICCVPASAITEAVVDQ